MSALNEAWRQHLRLAMLKLLDQAPGCSTNDSVLTDALRGVGFAASRDQVKAELAWLDEQGLARVEALDRLQVATLTGRGQDVAAGAATVPGVKRPSAKG